MSMKAFYPEQSSEVRSVLQMADKVFVVPQGSSDSEIRYNQKLIKDRLALAGLSTQDKSSEENNGLNKGNASYSVEVDTCNNQQVGVMVCKILGIINKPASSIKDLH